MATMQNTQAKSHTGPFSGYQAGQQTFGPQQSVQTSMGNFPTLQAYQQQQDAFVQQHLKNQAQYNQGLQSGQSPQRVPVMEAWKQAGENIQSGQYQGNPFQAGNVDAIMGMFNQYGIQAPQGFRDQLLQNLGQQSAPPMYQPQPAMGYPGGPSNDFIPKFANPATGLPYGQQPQMTYPGGPMPPGQMPSNDGFIDAREPGMLYQAVMVPYYNPATGETTYRTAGVVPAPGSGWVRGTGPSAGQPQPPTSMQPVAPPAMTYPGGPMKPPAPAPQPWQMGQQPQMTYPGDLGAIPGFDPATGLPYGQRPRDLVGDWGFGDYGPEPPRTPDQQRMDDMIRQQAEAAARAAQHERSLREMQERHPWLEPVRRSNSPTAQVIGWRPRSGAAQAKPARTQGTPYRSGKK